jgi:hypothetical protein
MEISVELASKQCRVGVELCSVMTAKHASTFRSEAGDIRGSTSVSGDGDYRDIEMSAIDRPPAVQPGVPLPAPRLHPRLGRLKVHELPHQLLRSLPKRHWPQN